MSASTFQPLAQLPALTTLELGVNIDDEAQLPALLSSLPTVDTVFLFAKIGLATLFDIFTARAVAGRSPLRELRCVLYEGVELDHQEKKRARQHVERSNNITDAQIEEFLAAAAKCGRLRIESGHTPLSIRVLHRFPSPTAEFRFIGSSDRHRGRLRDSFETWLGLFLHNPCPASFQFMFSSGFEKHETWRTCDSWKRQQLARIVVRTRRCCDLEF